MELGREEEVENGDVLGKETFYHPGSLKGLRERLHQALY